MSEKLRQASPNMALRDRRKERQWTQADVAELLGVTELTVRRWERGQSRPSSYYIQKLCALFEANAEELGLLRTSIPAKHPSDLSSELPSLTAPLTHNALEDMQKTQEPLLLTAPTVVQYANTDPSPSHLHRPNIRKRYIYISVALLLVVLVGFASYTIEQHFVFYSGISSHVHSTSSEAARRLLYQADWSKNIAGWTVTPHWHWSSQDGGMFTTDSMTNSLAIAPYHPSILNYVVEVRIQRISYSNIDGNAFGLMVMQTPTDGYVVGVGVHKTPEHFFIGQLSVSSKNRNPYISADLARASSNIDNGWHTYSVKLYKNHISSSFDGKQYVTANDYTNVNVRQVGIYAVGALIHIAHFKVYAI